MMKHSRAVKFILATSIASLLIGLIIGMSIAIIYADRLDAENQKIIDRLKNDLRIKDEIIGSQTEELKKIKRMTGGY